MAHRPIMTDPTLIDSLRGQQYLVLRPAGAIASFYDDEQAVLREGLSGSLSWPATGHVTLRGFSEPERVSALRDVLAGWAEARPAIDLRVVAIDGFPPPFQVVIAQLERTPALVAAYADLTEALDASDVLRIGELPLEEWVFHLSLIYARALDERDWHRVIAEHRREIPDGPAELVSSAEFVWYDEDGEHVETLPFDR